MFFSMPKRTPQTALSGKGKAEGAPAGAPNHLAMLTATAISKDDEVMDEIMEILPVKRQKDNSTDLSVSSDINLIGEIVDTVSETHNVLTQSDSDSSETDIDSVKEVSSTDLGTFSCSCTCR